MPMTSSLPRVRFCLLSLTCALGVELFVGCTGRYEGQATAEGVGADGGAGSKRPEGGGGDESMSKAPMDDGENGHIGGASADDEDPERSPCERGSFDHDDDPATECRGWTSCEPGEYVVGAGTSTSDRSCSNCAEGSFSVSKNQESCQPFQDCVAGEFVKAVGTTQSDRVCERCSVGTYNAATNRGVCTPCAPGTFSAGGARQCEPWRTCAPGTYVSREGTAKENRQCSPCQEGTETTVANQSECLEPKACPAGTTQTSPATEESLAVCLQCSPGSHCPGGTAPSSPCEEDTWDHDGDPVTACAQKTECSPGQSVSDEGSSTEDRSCQGCAAGKFSEVPNANSCESCSAGTFSLANASSCVSCPSGTDSDAGASECRCVPRCDGKVCGDDGCGGACGECNDGFLCSSDQSSCDVDEARWFHLESQSRSNYCLESNSKETGPDHGGNSFIYPCQNVTGQWWRFVRNGTWYALKSQSMGDGKCLESNDPDKGGSAFMDDCQGVSGQSWRFEPDGSWYRLKSEFQTDDRCLDSNDPTSSSFDGAVHMKDCTATATQRWRLLPR